jgi:hypothetical protein
MPPLPTPERLAPGQVDQFGVEGRDLFNERGGRIDPRIGREQSVGVGEKHQVRRADEIGDECGEAVVVAKSDLLIGHGIVLVHDRHDVERAERLERSTSVQVLAAMTEVERREQHLADRGTDFGEGVSPRVHEERLSDGGDGLESDAVGRSRAILADLGPPGGDRARGDHDDVPTLLAKVDDVEGDVHEDAVGDAADGVGHRRRADFHDHATRRHRAPPGRVVRVEPVAHVASLGDGRHGRVRR